MAQLISIVTIIAIALVCIFAEEEKYTDEFDYINPLEIVQNRKLRMQYYNCYMDIAPCVTADAKFLKKFYPEAFTNKCKRCTDRQKEMLEVIVDWYTKNEPKEWETIVVRTIERAKQANLFKEKEANNTQ